jgi:hypothetical protein
MCQASFRDDLSHDAERDFLRTLGPNRDSRRSVQPRQLFRSDAFALEALPDLGRSSAIRHQSHVCRVVIERLFYGVFVKPASAGDDNVFFSG